MTRKYIPLLVLLSILSALAVFPAAPVYAATITVTSKLDTVDPGRCRLRDAITAANTNTATGDCPAGTPGMDTIGFSLGIQCSITPCTITLTSALPTVSGALTINGGNTIISGANAFRVFDLGAVIVNISNLSIVNGNLSGTFLDGGAINMSGTTLTLTNVFFSNNHAHSGGAIYEESGTLTVANCNFSGNAAETGGGAIDQDTGLLIVGNSRFSNNTAVDGGGALFLFKDALISTSTFSGNFAPFGGAILNRGNMDMRDSVFNDNAATGQFGLGGGGAIHTEGTATLTNVTLSGNSAKNDGGGLSTKRDVISQTITLNNVTITNNTADSDSDGVGDGGGIYELVNTVLVQNSIIAGNFDTPGNSGGGTINPDCSGTYSSQGYNLIGRNDGCGGFVNGVNGDKVGTGASPINPLVGALANNGGTTQTHALLPGSPAMDAGNPLLPGSGGPACAASDQRGVARPQGSVCDIGAFEFEYHSLYLPLVLR